MKLQQIAAKLAPEEYEQNFADLNPLLAPQQAVVVASRCLYCFDAPCIQACPTRIDVPSFIKKISTGNLTGSARVILSANVLGESCGRVCPTEALCEGACVLNGSEERPVEIGRLQRYAVNYVLSRGLSPLRAGTPNGRRVACIGSGPASLACAAELAQRGYAVEIFDRNPAPGGLNTYGIAAYKSRAADSLREVKLIEDLGVTIHQGIEVTAGAIETRTEEAGGELSGTEAGVSPAPAPASISLAEIESCFDAVFIGVGLGETWNLQLPGEDLAGVYGAIEFIERTKRVPFAEIDVGRRVAVIGAGNTAVDVVTAARRLGAEAVYMVYRRGEDAMPAFAYEYELAKQDGVIFLWNTQPLAILGQDGAVAGLECVRTRLEGRGRFARVEIKPGSNFVLDVDMVVKALGQQPVTEFLRSVARIESKAGRVLVETATHQTANPMYFAGGDCVNGGKEVVDAVAEGMAAARGIDGWLGSRSAVDSRQSTVNSQD
ncbi:MAG TPA: NAD(P)-dependent oxidoreductase [Terriglobia bacterium]|nr:NAD(P)-dependent oxidoreductase [Terriglobia bacterium]